MSSEVESSLKVKFLYKIQFQFLNIHIHKFYEHKNIKIKRYSAKILPKLYLVKILQKINTVETLFPLCTERLRQ